MLRSRLARTAPLFLAPILGFLDPAGQSLRAQTPPSRAGVLVVVNDNSALSRSIAEYYALRREIPARNLCRVRTTVEEEIPRNLYDREIAGPISACLRERSLTEQVLYLVTTAGVPLRISRHARHGWRHRRSRCSELTLLYSDMHQGLYRIRSTGLVPNPFYRKREAKFSHPQFPVYLVTRLAAYDFRRRQAMDRSLCAQQAANRGKFVIDLKSSSDEQGNDWLRSAATLLPKERVVLDESTTVLYGQKDVIGYMRLGLQRPATPPPLCRLPPGCRGPSRPNSYPPTAAPSASLPTIGTSAIPSPPNCGLPEARSRCRRIFCSKAPPALPGTWPNRIWP